MIFTNERNGFMNGKTEMNLPVGQDDEINEQNRMIHDKKDRYAKLRKMLSTAALSVALISWYTTANGLHQYVFRSIWQAYIVSAALQGALFALSIKGIKIVKSFDKKIKGLFFGLAWLCLLVASSIFSYVFISKDVYSDRLLKEDSHRILNKLCLTENYKLNSEADNLLNGSPDNNGIVSDMNNYIEKLAVLGNGFDIKEGSNDKKLKGTNELLKKYAYSYTGNSAAKKYVDTSGLVKYINDILNGKFTKQDIENIKAEVDRIIKAIEIAKVRVEEERETKKEERDSYNNRLLEFHNTTSSAYKKLRNELKRVINEIKKCDKLISDLDIELNIVKQVPNILESVQKSIGAILYDNVIDIRVEMDAENINIEKVQDDALSIYNTLLENSVYIEADDPRITGYSNFRDCLSKYSEVIKAQEKIKEEIDLLYGLKSINEFILRSDEQKTEEDSDKNKNKTFSMDDEAWIGYWQEHLNSLKESVEILQKGGLDENLIQDLVGTIDDNERIYLSDLNDFERAWGLLFGQSPKHPYKSLLVFSVLFSFGIDLFSVLMSFFLYLFRIK